MEVYAADLEAYTAAREAYRQRAKGPMEKMHLTFQQETKTCKDMEIRGVAWWPNEIGNSICVGECVFTQEPVTLFGDERPGFKEDVRSD